jgi:hypothetical protein
MRNTQVLRLRALAALIGWLPLVLDGADAGPLLLALPGAGLLAGLLPVGWFPVVGPAQVALAGATLWLAPRLLTSGGWLSTMGLGLALLLNAGLWLRARRERAAVRAGGGREAGSAGAAK